MSDWKKAIKPTDEGEVGRVYFLNCEIIHHVKYGTESKRESWYDNRPFTLNHAAGKTILQLLTTSKDLPKVLKDQLLRKRTAEMTTPGGRMWRFWISESPAPKTYGNDALKPKDGNNARKSSLIGPDGKSLRF